MAVDSNVCLALLVLSVVARCLENELDIKYRTLGEIGSPRGVTARRTAPLEVNGSCCWTMMVVCSRTGCGASEDPCGSLSRYCKAVARAESSSARFNQLR